MKAHTQIYLFGDQTHAFDDGLCRLLQIKNNPVLSALFERVNYAIRLQIGLLPAAQKEIFPRFTSIHELLARYREASKPNPALESMLVCLHQLALFISHFGEGIQPYPQLTTSYLTGLCIGLLPAVAISTASTVVELLPAAIQAVLIAFRTGLRTWETRNFLDQGPEDAESQPWSVIVGLKEAPAKEALEQFCQQKNLPRHSLPYISSVSTNSVTLSGPPRILDQLLQTSSFGTFRPNKVSVFAPYHASHIYTMSDVDTILSSCPKDILETYIPRIPILSSVTGKPFPSSNYGTVLRAALREILIEPLRWDRVLEGCSTVVKSCGNSELCVILPIAANAHGLASALSHIGSVNVKLDPIITKGSPETQRRHTPGRPEQSKIAIIGYSGRFPDAASSEIFWDLLYKGLDVHRDVPKDRFDLETHFDPTGKKKNSTTIRHGCWIEKPGLFDSRFFQMSPREADNSDPGQRLALTTAYEAMEMAGFVPDRTPSTQRDRVGMFYGMTSDDWREVNSGQNVDTYFIPGGNRAFTPGRINYHFKFSGPSLSIDSACSSSFAAIHTACNALWRGDCDTAVAGGTNVMTNPDNFVGLDRGHFLSKTGNCKTFDDGADGYCRADGVGTVILKRLEDAIADNDPIQGVILGAYTNHSAEAVSMTRPHAGAQAYIFSKLLNESHIDPHNVSYIEMHGTGTQAGDAVEMGSVLEVFSPAGRKRAPEKSLHLGSAKANVGHAESASGVISLMKVLLMMEKNVIPPHPGFKTKINHTFPTDLKERNIHIAMKPTPWIRKGGQNRTVFLNNFSAAGGNTALLMEDAPYLPTNEAHDPRSTHLVAVSAKSISSLKNNISALIEFLDNNRDTAVSALSYTTTARRMHHNHRVIVNGSTLQSIRNGLEASAAASSFRPIPAKSPAVAFVFTGQGALYAGMGKELYENFSQFRSDIHHFDAIGQGLGFPSIQPLLDGTLSNSDDISPVISQLGTTCMQLALTRLWASWGVKPSVVVGHSLGEYAALAAAGVLSISDTIYLTGKRAQLLEEKCMVGSHSMLAVRTSVSNLEAYLLGKSCEVACINGPEDTVISGVNDDIEDLKKELTTRGFKCMKLRVPFAFHSAQVEPILESFEKVSSTVNFMKPSIPVISPLLGQVVTNATTFGPSYFSRACRGTVNFVAGLQALRDEKFGGLWLEIGSHPICSGMVKSVLGQVDVLPSLRRNEDTWQVLAGTLSALHLAGVEIHWDEYHREFPACHEVVRLPTYAWDYKNHWIQYVHDWCLTKGNPPEPSQETIEPLAPKLSTPSVQRIVEEDIGTDKATIVVESNLRDPTLYPDLEGHRVNGAVLVPSSMYADMALTVGDYLLVQSGRDVTKTFMDVSNVVVHKPLIVQENATKQLLRLSATVDWNSQAAQLQFYSVTDDGKKLTDLAKCILKFSGSDSWVKKWKRNEYLIKTRIEKLHSGVNDGQSHKIKRGMAYKLFGTFVDYKPQYRGMEEVILDSAAFEATASVKLQATGNHGNYHFPAYWIDSIGHLAGFTMNANDTVDPTQVFTNHGWDFMRYTTKFSPEKTYQTYVKMQNIGGTMYSGDVYAFEEGSIVAVFGGVTFQGVPRKVVDMVIRPSTSPQAQKPAKKSVPEPRVNKVEKTTKETKGTKGTKPVVGGSNRKAQDSGPAAKALAIIAEEIGLNVKELKPDSKFSDYGVDSLLALTIVGRIREELNEELPSSFFLENPSVADLTRCFATDGTSWSDDEESDEESGSAAQYTPAPMHSDGEEEEGSGGDSDSDGIISIIRQTVAEEIGIPVAEIKGNSMLAELGMDSLLALTVRGRLQEQLTIELPSDLFLGDATLDSVAEALGLVSQPAAAIPSNSSGEEKRPLPQQPSKPIPKASSILLQGNPKTARKILFLFPDGSGSATSYAQIPKISKDIAVYGLNCPFMKTPKDLPKDLRLSTSSYLEEIRRRQAVGPYYFGGWSAGGVCAYDAAQQLILGGEQVNRLVFLDSPCPIGLGKLPPRLYDFLNKAGLFGVDSNPPEWLFPHFLAFIDALDGYKAIPFAANKAPKTHMLWATDGVCNRPEDPRPERRPDDPKEMWWLLENRTNFGPNGWDKLLGKGNLVIETAENVNHFSMMEQKGAAELVGFIRKAMA